MASLLLTAATDPIQQAQEHYQHVAGYQMTVKSSSRAKTEIMRYYYLKPGYIRVEFITPYNGAALIYDPSRKQARLWPFGYRRFPALTLSPDNRLILSSSGHRIDQSDVGALLRNVVALQQQGKTEIAGLDSVDGKEAVHLTVEGRQDFAVDTVHLYQLWLEQATGFPLKVSSYDTSGQLIETVEMSDVQIDPTFPDGFFQQ